MGNLISHFAVIGRLRNKSLRLPTLHSSSSTHLHTSMLPLPQSHEFLLTLFILNLFLFRSHSLPIVPFLPVLKDPQTLQYVAQIFQRTPLVPVNATVHLGGKVIWVGCGSSYVSSTYQKSHCNSVQCSLAHASSSCKPCFNGSRPWCKSDACTLLLENVFTSRAAIGDLGADVVILPSRNGLSPGREVLVPQILFTCAPQFLVEGLAIGAKGVMGLGYGRVGLLAQLSSALNISKKFAVCLPYSTESKGIIFFGDGPYALLPNIDISKILVYTPLMVKPPNMATNNSSRSRPLSSYDYIIRVNSIRIIGSQIPLNPSLLSIGGDGAGDAKISTVDPYAILETSIYSSFIEHFVREAVAANATRVAAMAPFEACFSTKAAGKNQSRPAMPVIDLVLQNDEVFWRIFETNSMVPVGDGVSCLGFLDGGASPRASIIIGGHQLGDNLIQFDLVSSRLGFTSSLLLRETSCANFDSAKANNE